MKMNKINLPSFGAFTSEYNFLLKHNRRYDQFVWIALLYLAIASFVVINAFIYYDFLFAQARHDNAKNSYVKLHYKTEQKSLTENDYLRIIQLIKTEYDEVRLSTQRNTLIIETPDTKLHQEWLYAQVAAHRYRGNLHWKPKYFCAVKCKNGAPFRVELEAHDLKLSLSPSH
ncbi:hypothetical protein MTBPR1_80149 [Candidatus Terasakiella magnetica]|uniref:Uncharacterized protein n=1 Tax=Candidatus Terasakiella magnetica TaxID=1867952 RepID=A0A1C3RLE3_9PROT|nr:hypothetical protein [Candidatus Terasakiella magnetica]SCA58095.1 hypothetical protein MTBPR1_80149 [Candidatus Terasakiella magnetica]